MGEFVTAHKGFCAGVATFFEEPQRFGAGHGNNTRASLNKLEIENLSLQLRVDVRWRVLTKLLMGQTKMGLRRFALALREIKHACFLQKTIPKSISLRTVQIIGIKPAKPKLLVRAAGLEPARPKPRDFKSLVFTNFTTPALTKPQFSAF